MAPPFGALTYLYVGTADFARDLDWWQKVVGAEVVWNHHAFDAHVAALRVGPGPLLLLADHRPAPSVILLYAVPDLEGTVRALRRRGWKEEAGPFGIPDGPCYTFFDPSGNKYGVFQPERPGALEDPASEPQDAR